MHKSATKCNETIGKWCKNKHGASKIIDTFETYHTSAKLLTGEEQTNVDLQEHVIHSLFLFEMKSPGLCIKIIHMAFNLLLDVCRHVVSKFQGENPRSGLNWLCLALILLKTLF
jgi:hypothetical protein